MTEAKRIAFLGLGVMGAPMAGHLARAGHKVTVYNRTAAKAQAWLSRHGAHDIAMAQTPAEAARGQDVVLGNDGALTAMSDGSLFVDHTTVSPAMRRAIAGETVV